MSWKCRLRDSLPFRLLAARRDKIAERIWIESGCSTPPPSSVKRRIVRHYLDSLRINTLVETGTYFGDTVAFFRSRCSRIISIELSEALAKRAQARFRGSNHIEILQGDSCALLGGVMAKLDQPALFWLDGHYSGGVTAKGALSTPIRAELETILKHPQRHAILIDDARLFVGNDDYPTIDELRDLVKSRAPHLSFSVENDIVRCC